MSQAIFIRSPLSQADVTEYIPALIQADAHIWKVDLHALPNKEREEIAPLVLQQVKNKLMTNFQARWNIENGVVTIKIHDHFSAEDVAWITENHENTWLQLTQDGVLLSGEQTEQHTLNSETLADFIEDTIHEYIQTSAFLTVGAIRSNLQSP